MPHSSIPLERSEADLLLSDLLNLPVPLEFPWFAVRVKANREKVVAVSLRGKGFEQFLPLYRKNNRWSDRKQDIDVPLFSGYVFARFDPLQRLPILTIPGVVCVVSNGRDPQPVEEHELEAIRTVLKSGLPAEPWPFLKSGQRVRIDHGSMKGIEGVLLELKKNCRLVVSVTLLQRSIAVEIDRDIITPITSVCPRSRGCLEI